VSYLLLKYVQTNLADFIKDTPEGRDADAILRKCVHCGFCTATCPTYQLLGDELDGPRGRIYLIKQVLEGARPSAKTQLHLDRCLTCRSCETTCPSGVHYSRLLDIGGHVVDQRVPARAGAHSSARRCARSSRTSPASSRCSRLGQLVRPLLPLRSSARCPSPWPVPADWPTKVHPRRMVGTGRLRAAGARTEYQCAARARARPAGITLMRRDRRRLLRRRLLSHERGRRSAELHAAQHRRLVAARRSGRASDRHHRQRLRHDGAGLRYQLSRDPAYADKARHISELTKDISESSSPEQDRLASGVTGHASGVTGQRVAFHSPVTLQHGLKLKGVVESLLTSLGCELTPVPDAHLCCGSAGTYSLLQPELAGKLRDNKIAALESGQPDLILTANVGCQAHLQGATSLPSATG
jgi:glycolate oxidase iron-sulfur subunit